MLESLYSQHYTVIGRVSLNCARNAKYIFYLDCIEPPPFWVIKLQYNCTFIIISFLIDVACYNWKTVETCISCIILQLFSIFTNSSESFCTFRSLCILLCKGILFIIHKRIFIMFTYMLWNLIWQLQLYISYAFYYIVRWIIIILFFLWISHQHLCKNC